MTDQSQRYRVTGDNHYHGGERLRTGDVFTPTERELAAFGHKFEPVEDDDTGEDGDEDEGEESSEKETGDGYETYPRSELEAMDRSEIVSLASESGHSEVDGRSSTADIIAALGEDDG